MLAVERRNQIIALIQEKKSVLVQDLSRKYDVTEETIRRDLDKLEKQGILVKTYGGAVLADESKVEIPVSVREEINISGKNAIGKEAAQLVNDGDIIILDASTSALFVAKHIKDRRGLTVITNAVKVVLELAECKEITVISTGGILVNESLSYFGKAAENALSNYYASKVFFSCKGLTLNRGLTDSNEQVVEMRKRMLKCAEKVIFLCDHTKLGKVGFVHTAGFSEIDFMITDRRLPENWKEEIEAAGVQVRIADK